MRLFTNSFSGRLFPKCEQNGLRTGIPQFTQRRVVQEQVKNEAWEGKKRKKWMLCPQRKDSPKAVKKISGHLACFLEAQYGNPGNRPGFMKVVHELLGITKGTGYFQIEPAGMNTQSRSCLLVLFPKRSSCHVLVRSFHDAKLEKVKKVIGKAF